MDLLEHPLEAVAFRLYSLPEASAATGAAAWTCLAAVLAAAAAAGLWRLRASAVAAAATKPLGLDPCLKPEAPTAPLAASERRSEPAEAPTTAPSPKERYTAYYCDACRIGCCDLDRYDDNDDDDDREDDAEEHDDGDGAYRTPLSVTTTDPFVWEAEVLRSLPLSPAAAEVGLGPGRYRSPPALSGGSVVQLWDQVAGAGLTPTASPRRRGLAVATAPGF
ncbi:uncharacterized protein LOC120670232 [Panicum virgatum]|uniref:Uncharacterized protein n=1 Tax=Panicum virgatum TaxID=38727 RepID=A0A8T0T182_PANVG|nr:uncharacterized protein LOC120670232 [Panicum virgatum]KAG2604830.1 hypothetical protein PVAP13_4NG070100 [Panicum virgatum]